MAVSIKRKVIWAVDPSCKDCSLVKRTAKAVQSLASQWECEVEPVYLIDGFLPGIKRLTGLYHDLQSAAQEHLEDILKGVSISHRLPITLLSGVTNQLRDSVERLIHYAKSSNADLIIVGTRANKGPKRWFLGSFAETLISRSDVPVYIINPYDLRITKIKHILFPTDFSDQSKIAYEKVISFAKEIDASIILFHKVLRSSGPSRFLGFPMDEENIRYFQDEIERQREQGYAWAKIAQDQGVNAEPTVDSKRDESILKAILRKSKTKFQMIAIAAHSGPIEAAFLGSITRQLIRTASCPVWVIHTEQRKIAEIPFKITEDEVMADLISKKKAS